MIQLNPRLGALLRSGWTALDTDTRRKLGGKPLALWLQAFYATHEKPYPYKVETLRELSGSRTGRLRKFRENLKNALDDWAATGDIQGWSIDPETDLLHITKPKKSGDRRAGNRRRFEGQPPFSRGATAVFEGRNRRFEGRNRRFRGAQPPFSRGARPRGKPQFSIAPQSLRGRPESP